jgi:hypothetical protein
MSTTLRLSAALLIALVLALAAITVVLAGGQIDSMSLPMPVSHGG